MTPHTRSDFVVVANRLPVDRDPDTGGDEWRTAPGGLVTALHPVLRRVYGARGVTQADDLALRLDQLLPVRSLAGVEQAAERLIAAADCGHARAAALADPRDRDHRVLRLRNRLHERRLKRERRLVPGGRLRQRQAAAQQEQAHGKCDGRARDDHVFLRRSRVRDGTWPSSRPGL